MEPFSAQRCDLALWGEGIGCITREMGGGAKFQSWQAAHFLASPVVLLHTLFVGSFVT